MFPPQCHARGPAPPPQQRAPPAHPEIELPTPNAIAYLMLLIWPLVAYGLFSRMRPERALIWTILGGYLLLPPLAEFNLPLIPAFDKVTIPNLVALLLCVYMLRQRVELLPESLFGRFLLILFVIGPLGTVLTNSDPLFFSDGGLPRLWWHRSDPTLGDAGGLPGLRPYDAISAIANQAIYLVPFFLARQFLASADALRDLALALVVAGLIYSVPMLIEVRLSPQVNVWVYGFFQHSFDQMMRGGGFRPIVFLEHGLWVAFFALMCVVAALAMARVEDRSTRARYVVAFVYLAVVLVLCRTLGVRIYAAALLPLVLLVGARWQLRIAAVLALLVVAYPLLRGAGLVPVDFLVGKAALIDVERAASLRFRFDNEDILLAHAAEKPLFGWGGWGRNMVYDAAGQNISVTDGRWIIVIGIYGWIGYIVEFGLLALPLVLIALQAQRVPMAQISPYAGPLALILAVNMVDMLPNATLIPFTWLLAGAMLGHAEALKSGTRSPARARPAIEGSPAVRDRRRTIL